MHSRHNRTRIIKKYGVVPVTIYTANFGCDISCIYCPTFERYPKSYLSNQDTERARKERFSAAKQTAYWIDRLKEKDNDDNPSKLELIILGGTFSSLPKTYRASFVKNIYDKLNNGNSSSLEEAKYQNRFSKYRACVVTVETRPDLINDAECVFLQNLGVTKVELGVQSLSKEVLSFIGRPYTAEIVRNATRILKSYGFKVGFHVMVNLPKSDVVTDKKMFQQILGDARYLPDFVKIYPTTLLKMKKSQKRLWSLYRNKEWMPYCETALVELIGQIKSTIPNSIRLQRIQRQFGDCDYLYSQTSIRNEVEKYMLSNSLRCDCLRCRELRTYDSGIKVEEKTVYSIKTVSLSAKELFVEANVNKMLLGYIRVYFGDNAIIREVKVVGQSSPVGVSAKVQGNGVGKKMIRYAANCVKERGYHMLFVNAGPGAKVFFEKLNFKDSGFLMVLEI